MPAGAELRQHHRGAGALGARCSTRVSRVFFVLAGAAHRGRDPGDRARHLAAARPPLQRDLPQRRRCSAGSTSSAAGRDSLGLTPEQARVLERYHALFRRAGAGLDAAAKERLAAIGERLATLGTAVRPERAGRRAVLRAAARRGRSRRPAGFRARGGARRRRGARPARQARHHAVPLQRRALPAVLGPARPAREGLRAPGSRAARAAARPTTARSSPRLRAARRAGAAARLPDLRGLPARRHDGQDAGRRARPARRGLGAGARAARARSATPCRRWSRRRAATSARAVGLALLRREAAQGALRPRRGEIKPYLPLDNIIAAAFDTATRLFGLTFKPRARLPLYHPDVRAWEVTAPDGEHVGAVLRRLFRAALQAAAAPG